MSRRGVRRWQSRRLGYLSGQRDGQAWPVWLRLALAVGAVFVVGRIVGVW